MGDGDTAANHNDQLIRAIAADGKLRAIGVISTQAVEEARRRHHLSYVATAALGRTMSGALLLAANLKREQSRVNIQFRGDGPLGRVWVDAGMDGTVRGYVENPAIELPLTEDRRLDVGSAVGRYGYLHMLRDDGFGQPYTSAVELVSGEIGEDLTTYLATSEQTPSALLLGVMVQTEGVQAAGGLMLQLMPDAPPGLDKEMERRLEGVEEFSPLLMEGKSLQDIMQDFLGDLNLKIWPIAKPIRFYCKCNVGRVRGALKMLGEDELIDMIKTDEGAEATCHFCNEVYWVPKEDLEALVQQIKVEQVLTEEK